MISQQKQAAILHMPTLLIDHDYISWTGKSSNITNYVLATLLSRYLREAKNLRI